MPITDSEPYVAGHFKRVYDYLIKPAIITAGYEPVRADDVQRTNVIVVDVLRKTVESDMAVCDLSSRNPNVLFELGIRQAFNKPVTLIKDLITERVFDIAGIRTHDYDHSLRVDTTEAARSQLSEAIISTASRPTGDVNSLLELLAVVPAEIPRNVEVTEGNRLIMSVLQDIRDRMATLERRLERGSENVVGEVHLSRDISTSVLPVRGARVFRELIQFERAVLRDLVSGMSSDQVADKYSIAIRDVVNVVKKVTHAMGEPDLEAALAKAATFGLLL